MKNIKEKGWGKTYIEEEGEKKEKGKKIEKEYWKSKKGKLRATYDKEEKRIIQ